MEVYSIGGTLPLKLFERKKIFNLIRVLMFLMIFFFCVSF